MYRTADIFGAQAGTLKKGIVTKRKLNPLVPKYKFQDTMSYKERLIIIHIIKEH